MVDIATREPEKIIAGDTLEWTKDLPDYLPATWTLTYSLVKDGTRIGIVASDNGDGTHLVDEAKATTAAYAVGVYKWHATVDNGTDRHLVESGTVEVVTDFVAATSGFDGRAHCKIVLDAIEATIEGKATKDQSSYSIQTGDGSRSITRLTFGELIEARRFYKAEYQRLLRQERLAAGLPSGKTIHIRMPV